MPKLLIVEDNPDNSDSLSQRLQRRGYEVVIAADGVNGVVASLAEQPLKSLKVSWQALGSSSSPPSSPSLRV